MRKHKFICFIVKHYLCCNEQCFRWKSIQNTTYAFEKTSLPQCLLIMPCILQYCTLNIKWIVNIQQNYFESDLSPLPVSNDRFIAVEGRMNSNSQLPSMPLVQSWVLGHITCLHSISLLTSFQVFHSKLKTKSDIVYSLFFVPKVSRPPRAETYCLEWHSLKRPYTNA